MLRKMVRVGRQTDESWVSHIKRATHISEELATKFGVEDWTALFRKAKKTLADKISVCADSRWSGRALNWAPWHTVPAARKQGGQHKRWTDA